MKPKWWKIVFRLLLTALLAFGLWCVWRYYVSADERAVRHQAESAADLLLKTDRMTPLELAAKVNRLDRLVDVPITVECEYAHLNGRHDRDDLKNLLLLYFRHVRHSQLAWGDLKVNVSPKRDRAEAAGILTVNLLPESGYEYVIESRRCRLTFVKTADRWFLRQVKLEPPE